jgi:glycosyltransferase involved in cell wall biosynthesis
LIHAENLKNIWPNRLWIKKEINLIDKADSIMVVSEYLKMQLVQSGINPNKIMVNHNGVNPETFAGATTKQRNHARKALNLPDDSFVIGYVGGMEPFRKLPMMIRQIIEMMKNDSSIHFLMAGDGQDQSKINQIIAETRKGIQNRIHYNGTVPYDKIPALISSFDCAIFPYSNPYGSPQKIFEYMAMGIPVIGPNVPVVREIFENGRHLLLANQTGNDFIDLVKEIKDHTDTAHIMADNGCKLITEEFSWQNNARRLTEFISLKLEQF